MDVIINNPMYLNLLWVVAALGVLIVIGLVMQTRAKKRFADAGLWKHLLPNGKPALHKVRAGLLVATLVAMTLTLADIRWGKQWTQLPQRGIDIMFVVDVSRSMLARDAKPDRLDRAKQYIRDIMDEMGGDRAGLVVFAGKAKQKVPLTSNYSDLSMALDEIEPQSVPRGGTQMGEAIRVASNCFVDKLPNHKAIILFSDGEDQDSYPIEAAKAAYEDKGICVFTVGLGDAKDGARIPVRDVGDATLYLKYQGKEVWSKMNPKQLEAIALAGGGAFIPAGTKQVNMADVYHNHIAEIPQRQFQHARVNQYIPRYQWFAAAALLFLLLETLLAGRRNPKHRIRPGHLWDRLRARRLKNHVAPMQENAPEHNIDSKSQKVSPKSTITSLLAISILIFTAMGTARADSSKASELVRQANEKLTAGKVDEAISTYQAASEQAPDAPRLKYNQAVAQYRKGQYDQARKLLAESLAKPDKDVEARAKFNLGNCDYATALEHVNKKEKDKAIKLLEKAITQYQEALEVNANDSDARANIELAQLMIDQLKKEQKQQQKQNQNKDQKQKQQQNKKDQQKQSKQNQKKNDQQKQQNKQQAKNDKSESKKKPQDKKEQNQDQKKQKKQSSNDQNKQDEKKQQKKDQQNEKQKKQDQKQSPKKQKKEQPQNPQPKEQDKKQEQQKQKSPASQNPQDAKGKAQAGNQMHVEGKETKRKVPPEQARRMLQAVRDKNLQRRKAKLRRQRAAEMPVEKDW